MRKLLILVISCYVPIASADQLCGETGVWIQILGAGGPELDDRQGGPSYVIWNDNKARVLIDTGPGASVAFDKAEAKIEDLNAVLFTHLDADHAVDFPAFITGSQFADRTDPLIVLGPDSSDPNYPSTSTFIERLIGPESAFPYLQDFLGPKSSGGYRIRVRDVPSTGKKKWARFGNEELKISAIPVNHGSTPTLAWRVDVGEISVVIAGDFNNLKDVMSDFAKDADALVMAHAIPENSRGNQRELHALPTQIGRIASQADARLLILSNRMNRTLGRESQTRGHIEENYSGYILFANDMECWGL